VRDLILPSQHSTQMDPFQIRAEPRIDRVSVGLKLLGLIMAGWVDFGLRLAPSTPGQNLGLIIREFQFLIGIGSS
jgi:hypothetical protein